MATQIYDQETSDAEAVLDRSEKIQGRCEHCQSMIPDLKKFCPNCGATLRVAEVTEGHLIPVVIRPTCRRCKTVNEPGALYCFADGYPLEDVKPLENAVPAVTEINCPRCDTANEPGALYCALDGYPLEQDTEKGTEHGGFWVRLVANVIDLTLIWAAAAGLYVMVGNDPSSEGLWVLAVMLMPVVYLSVSVYKWNTTIGKRVCGLYVVRPDREKIGFGRALARSVAYLMYLLVFPVILSALMVGLRSDKRGLHDLITDTMVVKGS